MRAGCELFGLKLGFWSTGNLEIVTTKLGIKCSISVSYATV